MNILEVIRQLREAGDEAYDEIIGSRSMDRLKTFEWLLNAIEKVETEGVIPTKEQVKEQILFGRYDEEETNDS